MGARPLSRGWTFLLISASLAFAACGGKPPENQPEPSANEGTTIEVVNHSSSDMDIYLVRIGERVRIGTAIANVTTKFNLLPAQTAGVGLVTFVARPVIGGLARTISSEPTVLRAGDTITLDIPPP